MPDPQPPLTNSQVPPPSVNPLSSLKPYGMLAGVIVVLLLLLTGLRLFLPLPSPSAPRTTPEIISSTPLPTPGQQTSSAYFIAFTKEKQEIWVKEMPLGQERLVLPGIDESRFCGETCPTRSFDVSPSGTKLAADLIAVDGEEGFGYIDLTKNDQIVTFLHTGTQPIWSLDETKILFYDPNLQLFDLATQAATTLNTDLLYVDKLSPQEIILIGLSDVSSGSFSVLHVGTGEIRRVTVPELVDTNERILEVKTSPQRGKLLLKVTRGDGYDIGVVNIDGSAYTSITGFPEPAWAGSGYYTGEWAPDGRRVAIKDWFIPARTGGNGSRTLKIVDITGTALKTLAAKTNADSYMCWLEVNSQDVVVTGTIDGSEYSIKAFNITDGTSNVIPAVPHPDGTLFRCFTAD